MGESQKRIKALGEIALGVGNLDALRRFDQEVVGLELMRRSDHACFFRLVRGYGGHTQVLALFDRSVQPGYRGLNPATSPVDHITFEIDLADLEPAKTRQERLGLDVNTGAAARRIRCPAHTESRASP